MIQDKLAEIKDRYGDMHTRSDDHLNKLQEALPLAIQFHETHTNLLDVIAKIEPELHTADLNGPEAEAQLEKLQSLLDECKPLADELNAQAPQLTSLTPGHGAVKVEETVANDNRKLDNITDQVKRRADRMNLQRQKSMEVRVFYVKLLMSFA